MKLLTILLTIFLLTACHPDDTTLSSSSACDTTQLSIDSINQEYDSAVDDCYWADQGHVSNIDEFGQHIFGLDIENVYIVTSILDGTDCVNADVTTEITGMDDLIIAVIAVRDSPFEASIAYMADIGTPIEVSLASDGTITKCIEGATFRRIDSPATILTNVSLTLICKQ